MNNRKSIGDLLERGIISQVTNECLLTQLIEEDRCIFYMGIDPTNNKFHIGHLAPYVLAMRLLDMGARAIILIGGFTGKVGDPSFRNVERPLLEEKIVEDNTTILTNKLKHLFRKYEDKVIFVDNNTWLSKMNLSDFLNYSSHISANRLLKMEHISLRLQEELHLSFKEVCYTLLQAIDYEHLHHKYGVNLQIGGNDQYINILNGINLIDKIHAQPTVGVTMKLLLTKEGKKMGKTEQGAIWADGSLNVFEFWQYWRNVADEEVKHLFYMFSFLSVGEINHILEKKNINEAKILLANEMVQTIYGEKGLHSIIHEEKETVVVSSAIKDLATLLLEIKFVSSKVNAKKQIEAGAVRINGEKILTNIPLSNIQSGSIISLGKNKKNRVMIPHSH